MSDVKQYEYSDYPILYGPTTGKSLKKMFPELAEEPLFKDIPNEDLLFAWYLGSKSSPIDPSWTDEIRFKQAAISAFQFNKEKRDNYSAKIVPENVMIAVEKMGKYSPNTRLLAARTMQNHLHNILKMSQVDVEKDFLYVDKEGNELIDWTARNQYVTSVKTTNEIMPSLIKQLEDGFGIEKKKSEEVGTKAIDKYHQNKKDKK